MIQVINLKEYIFIAVVLVLVLLIVLKLTSKNFDNEMNKLVTYLGGKDNIIDCEVTKSRLKVTLKDPDKASKEALQKLGAKGIVEIDNQLKIIYDKNSRALKKYIRSMHL